MIGMCLRIWVGREYVMDEVLASALYRSAVAGCPLALSRLSEVVEFYVSANQAATQAQVVAYSAWRFSVRRMALSAERLTDVKRLCSSDFDA